MFLLAEMYLSFAFAGQFVARQTPKLIRYSNKGDVMTLYAHSCKDRRQPIEDHLNQVAYMAKCFAEGFKAEDWAYLAGLWHDIGKYQQSFQEKLEGIEQKVDHKIVGALLGLKQNPQIGLPLAFIIDGHHLGLSNFSTLQQRIKEKSSLLDDIISDIPEIITNSKLPSLPERFLPTGQKLSRQQREILWRNMEFWIRFVFSCLVDADFLDTEEFMKGNIRTYTDDYDSIHTILKKFESELDKIIENITQTPVNIIRADVLKICRDKAKSQMGIFNLTVPTGGGKTLSGMNFALRHAKHHNLKRIIVVIPFTSIIEQNAGEYSKKIGKHNVIEHHSNLDPNKETPHNKLASENWDAPIIVTTSVQFFESLFSNKPSRCRKLHNISESVIILDEVQTLPTQFLRAILDSLNELVSHYRCSVVLSTATPPALQNRPGFDDGLKDIQKIIESPQEFYQNLKRVEVRWPDIEKPPIEWEELADELINHDKVLAIVHRRDDAYQLAKLLPSEGLFHLSTLMCPKHRSDVLAKIRESVKKERICRLVSTQLVEAGVDIDFPNVYRALGGLDSMAQAAGRCNREGNPKKGNVVIFLSPSQPPPGILRKAFESMKSLLNRNKSPDICQPEIFDEFFKELYHKSMLDAEGIMTLRQEFKFAEVAEKFQMIEDGFSKPIIVPYSDSEECLYQFRELPSQKTRRTLQQYSVNIYVQDFELLKQNYAIELIHDTVYALIQQYHHLYDQQFGMVIKEPIYPSTESLNL